MFDKIVCLSLDKRFNEQGRIIDEFRVKGLEIEFFLAGDGLLFPAEKYSHIDIVPPKDRRGYPAWANRPNSYNAFLCFKKIIKKALEDNLENIALCEDDVTLKDNFGEVLSEAKKELAILPKWDMLYLCANHTWMPTRLLGSYVLKLNGSGGFQFVGINKSLFQTILDMPMIAPIDEMAGKTLHPKYNCYAVWPNIAVPLGGYSYCEGYSYDNSSLYNNRGC